MFTADAHCDALFQIAINGCAPEACTVTPESLRAGDVGVQTFALFSCMDRPDPHADGLAMLAAYRALPVPRLDGRLPDEPPKGPSAILSMEGGEILGGRIEALDEFPGLRLLALIWNCENQIATPAVLSAEGGLKPFGLALLRELDRRGIATDVSHLNEAGFWDVIERAEIPPLASHSDCRWLCDVPRNLTKRQACALIERGGFIGVNFFSTFLAQGRPATIEDAANHIDALCELGGERCVGFGSDFDGIRAWPDELASPADFPKLIDLLARRGYTQEQLRNIAGLNYWRYLKEAEARA